MSWDTFITEYLDAKKTVWAPRTRAVRSWHLNLFLEFVAEHGPHDPKKATEETMMAFHQRLLWKPGMRGKMLSEASIYGAVKTLSLFCRWAFSKDFLLLNPMVEVDLARPHHPFPKIPTVKQMKKLLKEPDLRTPRGLRDRAILEILYVLGLRRSECYRLDVTGIDLVRHQLVVRARQVFERPTAPRQPGSHQNIGSLPGTGPPRPSPLSKRKGPLHLATDRPET